MITIRNQRLLRLLGFEPISPAAVASMSWRFWLGVVWRELAPGVR
jgi:hypothetical protein